MAAYSITRAEIEGFWRRKEMEEEEQRVAAEKEAARIKAKTLKIEDYMLFEQMIREILGEGLEGDMARRTTERGVTKNSAETRIGIKHWWRRSSYAYLNEPQQRRRPQMRTAEANTPPHIFHGRDAWHSAHRFLPHLSSSEYSCMSKMS